MKAEIIRMSGSTQDSFKSIAFLYAVQDGEEKQVFLLTSTINKDDHEVINSLKFYFLRNKGIWSGWPEGVVRITAEIILPDDAKFKETWPQNDARGSDLHFCEQFLLTQENGRPTFEGDITFER
ncbi:MAG: hypothetical protein WCT54_03290 [Patescibacteria group bacterium]